MLHAPTSEAMTATMQSKSQLVRQPEQELHPHSFGAAGAYSVASASSPQEQRRQTLAGIQATHGNQAVLRMLHGPQQVARMPALRPSQSIMLQRKCACGGSPESTGECAECKEKREATLQRSVGNQATPSAAPTVPPIVHDVLSSPGQPLDAGTLAYMEPRFGQDFSQVRVHTDEQAAESAQAVNALAYTVGRDVVFGPGQYAPETAVGRKLLAHELTHTIQQSNVNITPSGGLTASPHNLLRSNLHQIQRQSGGGGSSSVPFWLRGVPNVRHIQGNIYEIRLPVYGPALVGPYTELDAYLGNPAYIATMTVPQRLQAHHIVGGENLGDTPTGFTYNNAPCIGLPDWVHNEITSDVTTAQNQIKGRKLPSGEEPIVKPSEAAELWHEVYSNISELKELSIISDNIFGITPPVSPTGGSKAPQISPGPQEETKNIVEAAPASKISSAEARDVETTQKGLTARVGEASIGPHPIAPPRPVVAAFGAMIEILRLENFLVNTYLIEPKQNKLLHERLSSIEPSIVSVVSKDPRLGVLLTLYYKRVKAPEESVIQPSPTFYDIDWTTGFTEDEAMKQWSSKPTKKPDTKTPVQPELLVFHVWRPPQQLASIVAISTPFPRVAVGTFMSGLARLQDVEWAGVFGFDDEGQTTLNLPPGITPRFLILSLPKEFEWFIGTDRMTKSIPIELRKAGEGGNIPVVNLDPVIPFSNVAAACVFPADDTTKALFENTPATRDTTGQIHYTNFTEVRWVRPENIKLIEA